MFQHQTSLGIADAKGYAPENTLEGIHTAADMDVKWVELDVKLTKAKSPILFHDEELERTTGVSGKLRLFSNQES